MAVMCVRMWAAFSIQKTWTAQREKVSQFNPCKPSSKTPRTWTGSVTKYILLRCLFACFGGDLLQTFETDARLKDSQNKCATPLSSVATSVILNTERKSNYLAGTGYADTAWDHKITHTESDTLIRRETVNGKGKNLVFQSLTPFFVNFTQQEQGC